MRVTSRIGFGAPALLALLVRLALSPLLPADGAPYITFVLATALSAGYGGLGPGLVQKNRLRAVERGVRSPADDDGKAGDLKRARKLGPPNMKKPRKQRHARNYVGWGSDVSPLKGE